MRMNLHVSMILGSISTANTILTEKKRHKNIYQLLKNTLLSMGLGSQIRLLMILSGHSKK